MAIPNSDHNQTRGVSDQHSPLLEVPNLVSPLLTEKQIAEFLNLSVKTIQAWRVTGRGPRFHRLGRSIRYDSQEVRAWIAQNGVRSTADSPQGEAGRVGS